MRCIRDGCDNIATATWANILLCKRRKKAEVLAAAGVRADRLGRGHTVSLAWIIAPLQGIPKVSATALKASVNLTGLLARWPTAMALVVIATMSCHPVVPVMVCSSLQVDLSSTPSAP